MVLIYGDEAIRIEVLDDPVKGHTFKVAVIAAQRCMHGCIGLGWKPCQGVHSAVLLEGLGGG